MAKLPDARFLRVLHICLLFLLLVDAARDRQIHLLGALLWRDGNHLVHLFPVLRIDRLRGELHIRA